MTRNRPPVGQVVQSMAKLQGRHREMEHDVLTGIPEKVLLVSRRFLCRGTWMTSLYSNRPLTDVEVDRIYGLKKGVRELYLRSRWSVETSSVFRRRMVKRSEHRPGEESLLYRMAEDSRAARPVSRKK